MFDNGVRVTNSSNSTEEDIIVDAESVNEVTAFVFEFTLESAPFAKYADQFAKFLTEDAFDESMDTKAVPKSGGFYFQDKFMDPFSCYFRNVRLSKTGEYKTVSREKCRNEACRICDQFFNDMKQDKKEDGDEENDTVFELDE